MKRWKIPLTTLEVEHCYVLPIVLATALFMVTWIVTDRNDVVIYGKFKLEPPVVKALTVTKGQLVMDVSWRQPKCEVKTQTVIWPVKGGSSYPVEGPHTSKDPTKLILVDKPRPILIPQLPPGEYDIGFEYVHGKCWWGEKYLPISNSMPERFRFRVE